MKLENDELIDKIKNELGELLEKINNSIDEYNSTDNKITDDEVKDWDSRVVKNIDNYKLKLDDSIKQYRSGDSEPLQGIASMISTLPKDLDNFSTDWMSNASRKEFDEILDSVTETAYTISTELYE